MFTNYHSHLYPSKYLKELLNMCFRTTTIMVDLVTCVYPGTSIDSLLPEAALVFILAKDSRRRYDNLIRHEYILFSMHGYNDGDFIYNANKVYKTQ